MPRLRSMTAAALLALTLFAALPSAAWSLRDRDQAVANTTSDSWGADLARRYWNWEFGALRWLQSIFAAEHGHVVPAPPTTP